MSTVLQRCVLIQSIEFKSMLSALNELVALCRIIKQAQDDICVGYRDTAPDKPLPAVLGACNGRAPGNWSDI